MGIKVIKDDKDNQKYIQLFNSRGVLMARVPMPDGFEELSTLEQYDYLKTHHSDLMKRIR